MEEHRTLTPTAIVSEKLFSVEMIIAAVPWNCFSLEDASAEHEYAFGFLLHFLSHFRSVSSPAKANIDILELGCQPMPVAATLSHLSLPAHCRLCSFVRSPGRYWQRDLFKKSDVCHKFTKVKTYIKTIKLLKEAHALSKRG